MAKRCLARKLYAQFGFTVCGPFADCVTDSNSVFMSLQLKFTG